MYLVPQRTGQTALCELGGALIPFDDEEPVIIALPGYSKDPVIPLFSTEARLIEFLDSSGIRYSHWMCVMDGPEFFNGIPARVEGQEVHLVYDLHKSEAGDLRWFEIVRD